MTTSANDDDAPSSWRMRRSSSSSSPISWRAYPCLTCGAPPMPSHKRCSRCRCVVYCSVECQRRDHCRRRRSASHGRREGGGVGEVGGGHGANCAQLGRLWEEKSSLERRLRAKGEEWKEDGGEGSGGGKRGRNKRRSTNPFDDDYDDNDNDNDDIEDCRPIVGKYWHDRPRTGTEECTTRYCVVLLQLVQLLGRGESWRLAATTTSATTTTTTPGAYVDVVDGGNGSDGGRDGREEEEEGEGEETTTITTTAGNPLAREYAIDLAFLLLRLDRTDMRVRLLLPSLLLEGGHVYEAYDYLRRWLRPEMTLMIMDVALMMADDDDDEVVVGTGEMNIDDDDDDDDNATTTTTRTIHHPDLMEKPEGWMDGDMVYPSVGMVFELAYLKCHLLCSSRRRRRDDGGGRRRPPTGGVDPVIEGCASDADADERELERQVALLLSVVHRWNPHLLPKLAGPYDVERGAYQDVVADASSSSSSHVDNGESTLEGGDGATSTVVVVVPRTPPALSTLLDARHPGFELQYRMGNPGGGTVDEAVSIWQRDMILWHVVDPMTMVYLANFCSNLEDNLVDIGGLDGGGGAGSSAAGSNDGSVGSGENRNTAEDISENASKRKEAEELVRKLRQEKPDRTMDQIMMHPEMAQLMIKHLHTN